MSIVFPACRDIRHGRDLPPATRGKCAVPFPDPAGRRLLSSACPPGAIHGISAGAAHSAPAGRICGAADPRVPSPGLPLPCPAHRGGTPSPPAGREAFLVGIGGRHLVRKGAHPGVIPLPARSSAQKCHGFNGLCSLDMSLRLGSIEPGRRGALPASAWTMSFCLGGQRNAGVERG